MNRARKAYKTARTCGRFVYSTVNITRLYDYQTWQTLSFLRNTRGAQRYVGFFFSWLCFSDADWLGEQTLITWCSHVQISILLQLFIFSYAW